MVNTNGMTSANRKNMTTTTAVIFFALALILNMAISPFR
jgi:hypothetical protein